MTSYMTGPRNGNIARSRSLPDICHYTRSSIHHSCTQATELSKTSPRLNFYCCCKTFSPSIFSVMCPCTLNNTTQHLSLTRRIRYTIMVLPHVCCVLISLFSGKNVGSIKLHFISHNPCVVLCRISHGCEMSTHGTSYLKTVYRLEFVDDELRYQKT